MVKKINHTPTPWKIEKEISYGGEIEYNIITVNPHQWVDDDSGDKIRICDITSSWVGCQKNSGTPKANAAFIVKACNNYAALVKALDDLVESLDPEQSRLPGAGTEGWCDTVLEYAHQTLKKQKEKP